MREAEEIRKKLFNKEVERDQVFPAVVTEVDETNFICTVQRESVYYYDVRLRGLVNPWLKGAALIPKLKSTVLVCRIAGSNQLYICLFTEIDKIIFDNEKISFILDNEKVFLNVNGTTAELSAAGVILNGGDNGALVKIQELNDNLNSLKDFVMSIHGALPAAFTAIGAGTASVGKSGGDAYSGSMAGKSITIKDMANPKVKH